MYRRSRDSSVGMATAYGLDGRGSIRGRDMDIAALEPTQPPIQWLPVGNAVGE
jgi:hypothetical protein